MDKKPKTDIRRIRVAAQAMAYAHAMEKEIASVVMAAAQGTGDPARLKTLIQRAFVDGRRSARGPLAQPKKRADFCTECHEPIVAEHFHCSGCKKEIRACTCQLELPQVPSVYRPELRQ
jgi:hypothetical protein